MKLANRIESIDALAIDERLASGLEAGRLIFVHGSMDSSRSFRALREEFPAWTTVAYDRRGYGKSVAEGEARQYDVEQQVQDLATVMGDRPCVLFGHSLGGVLSLIAASRHPRQVKAVVVYEAPMPWLSWWPRAPLPTNLLDPRDVQESAVRFIARAMGNDAWAALPEPKRAALLAWAPAWAAELVELSDGDWPFDPRGLTQPVLVLRGERADARQVRGSAELTALLDDVRGAVIPGAAHNAHARLAADLAMPVREFLAAVAGT